MAGNRLALFIKLKNIAEPRIQQGKPFKIMIRKNASCPDLIMTEYDYPRVRQGMF